MCTAFLGSIKGEKDMDKEISFICRNAEKYRKRQNIVMLMALCSIFIVYVLECYFTFEEHNISRFLIWMFVIFLVFIIWNRYRKIEVMGNCGVAKWFGTHYFYVSDIEKLEGRSTLGIEEEKYLIRSKKHKKTLFITVKTDENRQRLLTYIDYADKKYVDEPMVEKKYKKSIMFCTNYEIKYGCVIENATLVGGMDSILGRVTPVYKFKDEQGKHMLCGAKKLKKDELERKIYKKCSVYYAPGKSDKVIEVLVKS